MVLTQTAPMPMAQRGKKMEDSFLTKRRWAAFVVGVILKNALMRTAREGRDGVFGDLGAIAQIQLNSNAMAEQGHEAWELWWVTKARQVLERFFASETWQSSAPHCLRQAAAVCRKEVLQGHQLVDGEKLDEGVSNDFIAPWLGRRGLFLAAASCAYLPHPPAAAWPPKRVLENLEPVDREPPDGWVDKNGL